MPLIVLGYDKNTGYKGPALNYKTALGTMFRKFEAFVPDPPQDTSSGSSSSSSSSGSTSKYHLRKATSSGNMVTFYTFGYDGYVDEDGEYVGGTVCYSFADSKRTFYVGETHQLAVGTTNKRYCYKLEDVQDYYYINFIVGVVFLSLSLIFLILLLCHCCQK